MKEFTVSYSISEEEEKRIRKIKSRYEIMGIHMTEEELFTFIMTVGSSYDIDNKLKVHEKMLELQEI